MLARRRDSCIRVLTSGHGVVMEGNGEVEDPGQHLCLGIVAVHKDGEGRLSPAGVLPQLLHLTRHHREALGRH